MKKIKIILLLNVIYLSSFSQRMIIRNEIKDTKIYDSYNNELNRLSKEYKVNSAFGFIKVIVKDEKNNFDETTRVIEKTKEGEVNDYFLEGRYISYDLDTQTLIKNDVNEDFSLAGQTFFKNGIAKACVFFSRNNQPYVLVKFLKESSTDYFGRQENNCYSSSYIVENETWYYLSSFATSDEIIKKLTETLDKK